MWPPLPKLNKGQIWIINHKQTKSCKEWKRTFKTNKKERKRVYKKKGKKLKMSNCLFDINNNNNAIRCCEVHLLLCQPPLDLLFVTDAVGDGSRQLGLDARKPWAEVTHVFIQLLDRHQSFLQLLHPERTQPHQCKKKKKR